MNVGLALIPQTFEPFTALTSWIDIGGLLVGPWLIIGSVALMVLSVGLVLRFRTAWALTITALVLIAGSEFLFTVTAKVAIAVVVLAIWLFWKRDAFDRPVVLKGDAARLASEFREVTGRLRSGERPPRETAATRVRRKTGWEQQAEKGASLEALVRENGILMGDDGEPDEPAPAKED